MKTFLFIIISFTSFTSIAQISANQISIADYEERANKETQQMNNILHFDKVQRQLILVINKDYYYQLSNLQSQKLTLIDRKRLLSKLENKRERSFRENLTAQQYQLHFNKLSEKKARWQHLQDSLTAVRRINQKVNSAL